MPGRLIWTHYRALFSDNSDGDTDVGSVPADVPPRSSPRTQRWANDYREDFATLNVIYREKDGY